MVCPWPDEIINAKAHFHDSRWLFSEFAVSSFKDVNVDGLRVKS